MNLNEFLCKHAQPDLTNEKGEVIKKPDGTPYKKGKVTFGDAVWNLILKNIFIFAVIYVFILFVGCLIEGIIRISIGNKLLNYFEINNTEWYYTKFLTGLIVMGGTCLVLYLFVTLWSAEIAVCPNVEKPPEPILEENKSEDNKTYTESVI